MLSRAGILPARRPAVWGGAFALTPARLFDYIAASRAGRLR